MCTYTSSCAVMVVLVGTLSASGAWAQTTWHVDDDVALGGDGTSWPTAFTYLQDALSLATDGDEILVAGGTYEPDKDEAGNVTLGNRSATFQLITGVGLYGGYAGLANLANPDERDIEGYESILSGDLDGDDTPVACTQDIRTRRRRFAAISSGAHRTTRTSRLPVT